MIRFREIRKIREVTEWAARVQGNGIPVFETGFEIDPDERIVEKDANIPKFTVREAAAEIDPDERIPVREAAAIDADKRVPVLEAAAM
jgi:hypothetical protein